MITRVEATHEKMALLQEMQTMINDLKKQSARIEDQINKMIEADLESMQGETIALQQMVDNIKTKSNGTDKKAGTSGGN